MDEIDKDTENAIISVGIGTHGNGQSAGGGVPVTAAESKLSPGNGDDKGTDGAWHADTSPAALGLPLDDEEGVDEGGEEREYLMGEGGEPLSVDDKEEELDGDRLVELMGKGKAQEEYDEGLELSGGVGLDLGEPVKSRKPLKEYGLKQRRQVVLDGPPLVKNGDELDEMYAQAKHRLNELLPKMTLEQMRYIACRYETMSDKQAAEMAHVALDTVKRWPKEVNEVCKLLALDTVLFARAMRQKVLPRAMLKKVEGLNARSERLQQETATEIVEWEMGKAQVTNVNKNEGEVTLIWDMPRTSN